MGNGVNFFFSILNKFGWLGNWLFLFFALLECAPVIGSVFPGATLIAISGFLAAQGLFKVTNIIIFATLGAFIGDYAGYLLGRYRSAWVKKLVGQNLLDKGEEFFKKYGHKSIFWGRFFGATRAMIPFIAGLSKMRQRSFLTWNLISSLVWSLFNVFLGYFSGSVLIAVIKKLLHKPLLIFAPVIFSGLIYWVIKRHGQNIRTYYQTQYQRFTVNLLANRWFLLLAARYPVVSESAGNAKNRRQIFNILLGVAALLLIYILTTIFDLF